MLREVLLATALIFGLAVYILVAGPVVEGVADVLTDVGSDTLTQEEQSDIDLVQSMSLVWVPTVFGFGVLLWLYSRIAHRQRFRGRRRRP